MLKCLSCGGTYNATLADGTQYFHRCPPLSLEELTAAVAAGKVDLPKGETVDEAFERRVYERAHFRDENLTSTHEQDAGKMRAAGAGVVELPDVAPIVTIARP